MLPLLLHDFGSAGDEPKPWRSALVLELAMCNFVGTNWVALVDAQGKYIQHLGSEPSEQLFDLRRDPYELNDLLLAAESDTDREKLVRPWRLRLAHEFLREQRSRKWLTPDGKLADSSAYNCSDYELTDAYTI